LHAKQEACLLSSDGPGKYWELSGVAQLFVLAGHLCFFFKNNFRPKQTIFFSLSYYDKKSRNQQDKRNKYIARRRKGSFFFFFLLYKYFIIAKTSLQLSTSICYGTSFLTKRHTRTARIDSAAGHLCLLAGCAGLLGLGPFLFLFLFFFKKKEEFSCS
jgi:hypothetical protein